MSPRQANFLQALFQHSRDESSCSSASLEETAKPQTPTRTVSFGVVSIREYNRVLGDHPETKKGPSIALGDEYVQKQDISVDEFEQQSSNKDSLRRMTALERINLLVDEWGYSREEVSSAEKEARRAKKQRKLSEGAKRGASSHPWIFPTCSRDKLLKNFSMTAGHRFSGASFAIPA